MKSQEAELKDILARVIPTIRLAKLSIITAIIMVAGVRLINLVPYPEQINQIILALFVWAFTIYLTDFLVKASHSALRINNIYFTYVLGNIILLDWIVYNAGGAEWVGAIFYLFPIAYASIVFSRKRATAISILSGINYIALALLQYFAFIPYKQLFPSGNFFYKDPTYLSITISFVFFAFVFIGLAINIFTELLRKRTFQMEKTKSELEEAKNILEVKVKARTKELEELVQKREATIQERTKELRAKMEELEKFQKLSVGREIKMIELKEEIERLKEEIDKYKSK